MKARAAAMTCLAASLAACGGVTYVGGPQSLGAYTGSGMGASTAEYHGRLDPKDATIERGTYADHYSLVGAANERVYVALRSSDLDAYVLVVDGAGRVLAENDDSDGSLNSSLTLTLPHDGIYLVVATSYSRSSGSYRLRVDRTEGRGEYPYLALPTEVERRYLAPDPTDDSGNPYHVYAFDVRGGSELSVRLRSGQADTLLRLYDGQGHELASDDDSGGQLDAHLLFTPPSDARYYLVATTFSPPTPWGGASYHLTVTQ